VFVAVSDNMRIVPDQIAPWVPGGLTTLGTDGFGRSDTRARMRRFFDVDVECTVIATLWALARQGKIKPVFVQGRWTTSAWTRRRPISCARERNAKVWMCFYGQMQELPMERTARANK
jgi:hypothetical protein